ncbi:MAG: LacI family DNA-binding transcriptional regulator, partial [Psychrilyobacter sp.]|nr:LacI family DNA-binding transcriptional regulator [Psychrilyobacter sp.]
MAKITIKDIAKKAEVGVGTVSRIINNHPGVKEKTREKVLKIIKELNFKPNSMAIALKRKKDNLVGIVIAGYSNLFFNDVISGIDSELKKVGLNSVV